MGVFQDKPDANESDVWARVARDQPNRHNADIVIDADYVFGRMIKLFFTVKGDTITYPENDVGPDYQSWACVYPTIEALLSAADADTP